MQDGYDQTLSGLLRKRAELSGEAAQRRQSLDDTLAALDAIDAAIRVFDPTIAPDMLPSPGAPREQAAATSQIRRFLIDLLRTAGRPLKTLDATKALMDAKGIDPRDRLLATLIRKRTTDALGRMRKLGIVEGRKYGSGSELEWRLAAVA